MRHKFRIGQLALFLLFLLFGLSFVDMGSKWAAALLILGGALLVISERREWRPIPSVSLLVVAYVAGYALPVLLFPGALGNMPDDGVDRMMRWALRGFIIFALAYSLAAKREGAEKTSGTGRQGKQASFALFAYLVLGLIAAAAWLANAFVYGVGMVFIEGSSYGAGSETMRQVLALLADMKYAYLLGYLLLRGTGHAKKIHHWLVLVILAIALIEVMLIGSKAAIIKLLVVGTLSVTLGEARRLKWSSTLAGGLAVAICLLSFSIITEYRYIIRSTGSSGQQVTDVGFRYQAFKQATIAAISDSGPPRETSVDSSDIASRFGSGAFGFSWILEFTHGIPPYENSITSFLAPFHAIIPRFMWEGKPIFFNSGRFASEYFGWSYGGISISLLGSLYFAWGYAGILIGMAVFGIILATIISRVEKKGFIAVSSIVCLTVLMLHMLDVGAGFQPAIVNITRALILMAGIRIAWRIQLGWRSSSSFDSSARWR